MFRRLSISLPVTAFAAVTAMSLFSCKKEDAKFPYTDVVSFTVTAEGQALKAAVAGDSLILYWPVEKQVPDSIAPVIVVSPGATISPASGVKVAAKSGVTYKVTSQTGIVKEYKLHIPNNFPKVVVKTFSGINSFNDKRFIAQGERLYIQGDFFGTAEKATTVNMITAAGTEKNVDITLINPLQIQVVMQENASYKGFIIRSNGYEIRKDTAFEVVDNPYASVNAVTGTISVKRGTDLTMAGISLNKVTSWKTRKAGTSAYIELPVKSATATSITVAIPADFAVGTYDRVQVAYAASDYNYASTSTKVFSIAVTE